jgi:fatty-acyl-CoA synthase
MITALAETQVCLRRVEAAAIYEAMAREGVTHLCGGERVFIPLSRPSRRARRRG